MTLKESYSEIWDFVLAFFDIDIPLFEYSFSLTNLIVYGLIGYFVITLIFAFFANRE